MNIRLQSFMNRINFRAFLVVTLILTGFIQFFIMASNISDDTYDIKLTELAPETIRANKTVEDSVKTKQEQDAVENAVEPVFVLNEEVANNQQTFITNIFESIDETKIQIAKKNPQITSAEQLKLLKTNLKNLLASNEELTISDSQLSSVLNATNEELNLARQSLLEEVQRILSSPFRNEEVEMVRNDFIQSFQNEKLTNEDLKSLIVEIGRASIVETSIYNEDLTRAQKQQARNAIEPTRILQGQVIVQEGEYVDREIHRQLELLGMLQNKVSVKPIIAIVILTVLQMALFYILFSRSQMGDLQKKKSVILVTSTYLFTVFLMKLFTLTTDEMTVNIAFAFPTAFATMLIRMLVNDKAAALITVMTAVSAGILFEEEYAMIFHIEIVIYIILGGFAALFSMRTLESRSHLLQAALIVSVFNIFYIVFYMLMSQMPLDIMEMMYYMIAGLASGIVSGILAMGFLPFIESVFGILSTIKLIELSNPNHPLLKKILIEAPGTYHHSVMVANLADAACEVIDANGLLARVGCYYHDVGKTVRPLYFIENQMGKKNIHDQLPPDKSAQYILAHTNDGAELLRKHKMPQEIIDIALQHHGTSLLKYFVFKAKEAGLEINEDDFRYTGPKPQTKEAAIISIADSVEAAVRSMAEPSTEKIKTCIQAIIQDRVQDHQFDECDLTMKELKKIEQSFCETLNGIFHSRIEYPKD